VQTLVSFTRSFIATFKSMCCINFSGTSCFLTEKGEKQFIFPNMYTRWLVLTGNHKLAVVFKMLRDVLNCIKLNLQPSHFNFLKLKCWYGKQNVNIRFLRATKLRFPSKNKFLFYLFSVITLVSAYYIRKNSSW
jgi:hypothetical protein